MDSLIDRLKHQTDEFDASDLDPQGSLPGVVRRGRQYLVVVSTASILGVTAAVAGAVVAVPQIVQQMQGPSHPTVLDAPEDDDAQPTEKPDTEDAALKDPVVTPTEETTAPAADTTAPALAVLTPADGGTVTSKNVTFSGTTEPGARVAASGFEASVDDDGSWSLLLIASPGANTVTFDATDATGNTTTRTVTITYQPTTTVKEPAEDKTGHDASDDTTPTEETSHTFTASQQKSTLDAAPYTNTYSGTADPGTKIKVVSDHGWGYDYADDAGNWQVQVTFDPPAGTKTFPVTARYYHDAAVSKTFELTTVADEAAAFTATQQSSSVSATDPTNVYSGTGQPGHEVLIWTEKHGQTTTVIGEDGTWKVTLTYTAASAGDTFAVKALDQDSHEKHHFEVTITE